MKTVLITGSSRGIGRETAIYFAQQGWNDTLMWTGLLQEMI